MDRQEVFQHIDRDKDLKEEILTRIGEDPDLGRRLQAKTERVTAARPHGTDFELAPAEGTPPVTADRARDVLEHPPAIPVDPGMEAIILTLGRPVLIVRGDDFVVDDEDAQTWRERLEPARAALRTAIRSVGRVELDNHPRLRWAGTGWVVAEDLIVTNRHVAEVFARRTGDVFTFRSSFLGPMAARIDFREELGSEKPAEFRLVDVLHIEDDAGPDMAVLRIDWAGDAARRPPIVLADAIVPETTVAVIGYPAKDSRTGMPDEMDRIFGKTYDVKRLAPGDVTAVLEQGQLATHDCTTLGGNSGSVVIALDTGQATALHFAGRELDRNFAVPAPLVRARLDRLHGAARSTVRRPERPREAVTLEDLRDRDGYDPGFLGPRVDHPVLPPETAGVVAPVTGNEHGILDYSHFSVRMHRDRCLALYTAVNVNGGTARNVRRRGDNWRLDPRLDAAHQVGNELYQDNNLDRGHLVRRLDPAWGRSFKAAEAAALDTFFYTNCAPQHQSLNQELWLGLEDYILGNADIRDLKVSVFTGPIFRDDDRVYRDVRIPEDFWKVVAVVDDDTGRLSATGYVVSQRDFMHDLEFAFGAFKTYQVPLTTIEEEARLDFGDLKDVDPLAAIETTAAARPLNSFDDIVL